MDIHTDCNVIELASRRIQNVRYWHVFVLSLVMHVQPQNLEII
jgi:hypothetical protein